MAAVLVRYAPCAARLQRFPGGCAAAARSRQAGADGRRSPCNST